MPGKFVPASAATPNAPAKTIFLYPFYNISIHVLILILTLL
ncbi:hypothetical protein BTJ45_04332 [Bacillus mycoides]|nr:hypothetical protein BTJ45_04332 [Bacillus mycoides]